MMPTARVSVATAIMMNMRINVSTISHNTGTADAVTPVADVTGSLTVFTLLYAVLLVILVAFLRRLAHAGARHG